MGEDLGNHGGMFDGADDLQGAVALGALPDVDLEPTMRSLRRLRPALYALVALTRSFNALGLRRRRLGPLDLEEIDRETRAAYGRNRNAKGPEGEARLAKYALPLLDLRTTATGAYLQALLAVTEELPHRMRSRRASSRSFPSAARSPIRRRPRTFLERLPDCEIVAVPARHWIPIEQPQAMRSADAWLRRCFAGGA